MLIARFSVGEGAVAKKLNKIGLPTTEADLDLLTIFKTVLPVPFQRFTPTTNQRG